MFAFLIDAVRYSMDFYLRQNLLMEKFKRLMIYCSKNLVEHTAKRQRAHDSVANHSIPRVGYGGAMCVR
jgi:hypothetical protein